MVGEVKIGTKLDTKQFDREIEDLENRIQDLEKQEIYFEAHGMTGELKDVQLELEKTRNKLIGIRTQQAKIKSNSGLSGIVANLKTTNSSLQNAISKVARLALGIFGIRSAYMALRRASSDLASYDEQYATNLEYIRYALTQAVAPVLRYIVNLAATLLQYIYAILNAWFGIGSKIDISAESFNKMKNKANGVSKAVKEIKKQLTGFDEINMLTDQSDTGISAGGAGYLAPGFDLSAGQGEIPKWLQWIIDNKDLILGTLAGIAGGLAFLKLANLAADLGLIEGKLLGIKAIGFGLLIKGIIDLISTLKKYIQDPSWENFGKVIKSIGEIILGVGLLILNVPTIVAGAIALIMGLIIQHWQDIKEFFQKGIDWLTDKSDWVHQMFGDTINNIKQILDGIIEFVSGVFAGDWQRAWEGIAKIFGGIWDWIKNTVSTVLQIAWNTVTNFASTIGEAVAGIFKAIVNSVFNVIESILNNPIRIINTLTDTINTLPGVSIGKLPEFNLPRLKVGGIINMPNKGTMLGSAIGGESGREGVIPLTDQQAMAELGAEIGRNVIVNLTNITKVGNRQIAREIKQINAEQDFAFNR